MIRTIIPPTINTESYRNAMIAILFFSRIIYLSPSPSVSISYLTAMVAAYLLFPTDSVKGRKLSLMLDISI